GPRDESNTPLRIKIVPVNSYSVPVINPRHAARYRPVTSMRVWPRHIFPSRPKPLGAEHFIILRNRQITMICHPTSNLIVFRNHSPKGPRSCQLGNDLS